MVPGPDAADLEVVVALGALGAAVGVTSAMWDAADRVVLDEEDA